MRIYIIDFLRKYLTNNSRKRFKNFIYKARNKYKRILRLIYGTVNDEEICNNIFKRIGNDFDILMIHCSFNSMLPIYTGNLNKLLSIILSYCKQNNITLAMPAFLHVFNLEAKKYYEKNIFDVNNTYSGMGLLTELFRRTPGVKRSIHPTHSVCVWGPLADELTRNHHLADTTFGEGTPFGEMAKYKTMILGIGTKSYLKTTQMHSVEDILKSEFPISFEYLDIIPVTCIDNLRNSSIYNLAIKKQEYYHDIKFCHKILKKAKVIEWTYKSISFFLVQARLVNEAFIEAARNGQTMYKKK